MSNKQLALYLFGTMAAMFLSMAWLIPKVTTPPPEYVQWKEACQAQGGKVFQADANTYCVYGRMELRP